MKRLIDDQLLHWKTSSRRKPLIIRGGRQIGKTWSIDRFGQDHFGSIVKIDLEKRRDLHDIFVGDLSSQTILSQLALVAGQRIVPDETLLFLDEIQACPRALMALRYLYEEQPALHVIAAGSLLEFALGDLSLRPSMGATLRAAGAVQAGGPADLSFPVGRVRFLDMYPMTFAEFLWAGGQQQLVEILQKPPVQLDRAVHHLLLNQLRQYFFVGGMPEAVRAYYENLSVLDAFEVQTEILDSYRQDFAKYAARADKNCLDGVLVNCAAKVGEQIKYARLVEGFSNPTIHKAFDLLCMAKVINRIPAVKTVGQPLGASINNKKFKSSLIDIGLMQRLNRLPVDIEIRQQDLLTIYRGKLAEQFVAQELLVTQNSELYYWARAARGSTAEVDYLVNKDDRIYAVEVKSGKGGSLKSLHMLLDNYPACREGLVLYSGAWAELPEQKIRFIPLYYAGSLV